MSVEVFTRVVISKAIYALYDHAHRIINRERKAAAPPRSQNRWPMNQPSWGYERSFPQNTSQICSNPALHAKQIIQTAASGRDVHQIA